MPSKKTAPPKTVANTVQSTLLGQLEDARVRLVKFERELVKKGKAQQKELQQLIQNVRSGAPLKNLEKQASSAGNEVKKRLDGLQGQVLGVLGVATRSEISQLNKELAKLSKKIDSLTAKKSPALALPR
jgi:polyhydroxyalkanoate synthesis regulator phasin